MGDDERRLAKLAVEELLALAASEYKEDEHGYILKDCGIQHRAADDIVCNFIRALGHGDIADAYEKVRLFAHYS